MTCPHCVNGLRPIEWADAKPGDLTDFAVCLCDAGQAYRKADNQGHATVPLWQVWAAQHGVHPSRVVLLEAIYTAAELAVVGLGPVTPQGPDRAAALLAAGSRAKR